MADSCARRTSAAWNLVERVRLSLLLGRIALLCLFPSTTQLLSPFPILSSSFPFPCLSISPLVSPSRRGGAPATRNSIVLAKSMSSGRIYKFIFRKEQPQWLWDLALEVRLPALFLVGVVYVNTKCYYDALSSYQAGSRWGITQGKLLELRKLNYRHISVPRYAVKYEFEVDGKRYVSTRGTTGSPYRNWMEGWYDDTITEAEYLQAIPVLRVGERCSVFYDKKNPKAHSALAQDANSFEISFLGFLAFFPLLMGHYMKAHFWMLRKAYMPNKKIRVRFPVYDHPKPPPPPPKEPRHISQSPPKS